MSVSTAVVSSSGHAFFPSYFHHSLVNLLEHRCSPFCNFRFGVPETGSIWDRDRFAEPPIGCRARGWHHWRMVMGPSVLPNVILPVVSLLLRHVRRRRTQPCGPPLPHHSGLIDREGQRAGAGAVV